MSYETPRVGGRPLGRFLANWWAATLVRVYVLRKDGSPDELVCKSPRDVQRELRDADIGDAFTVRVAEMARAAHRALLEFEGWS